MIKIELVRSEKERKGLPWEKIIPGTVVQDEYNDVFLRIDEKEVVDEGGSRRIPLLLLTPSSAPESRGLFLTLEPASERMTSTSNTFFVIGKLIGVKLETL